MNQMICRAWETGNHNRCANGNQTFRIEKSDAALNFP